MVSKSFGFAGEHGDRLPEGGVDSSSRTGFRGLLFNHACCLKLHPALAASHDPLVRTSSFNGRTATFFVPARTPTVFLARRSMDG